MVAPIPKTALARSTKFAPRVWQTLGELLRGRSEKEVAAQLAISPNTVHVYVRQLYRTFNVRSRAELLALWVGPVNSGLMPPGQSPSGDTAADREQTMDGLLRQRRHLIGELAKLDARMVKNTLAIKRLRNLVKTRFS